MLPQAAMAMQAYSDWAPKEFDESALGKEAANPAADAAAAAAAMNGTAASAAGAAADGAEPQQQEEAKFEYDAATGGPSRILYLGFAVVLDCTLHLPPCSAAVWFDRVTISKLSSLLVARWQ